MLSPTYEITTALSHTDELISPPYDIEIVTISYGRVTMSSVWDSMMSKKNMGWPFYAAVTRNAAHCTSIFRSTRVALVTNLHRLRSSTKRGFNQQFPQEYMTQVILMFAHINPTCTYTSVEVTLMFHRNPVNLPLYERFVTLVSSLDLNRKFKHVLIMTNDQMLRDISSEAQVLWQSDLCHDLAYTQALISQLLAWVKDTLTLWSTFQYKNGFLSIWNSFIKVRL